MNLQDISPRIKDALLALIKNSVEARFENKSLTVNDIYPHLSVISREAQIESEKYLEETRPEIACTIFILVSEVFNLLAKSLAKEKNISEMLVSAAVSWSARAESIIDMRKDTYQKHSSSLTKVGNYDEASNFKTRAAIMDYRAIRTEVLSVLYSLVKELLVSLDKDPRMLLDLLDKEETERIGKDNETTKKEEISSIGSMIVTRDLGVDSVSLKDTIEAIVNKGPTAESTEFITPDDIVIVNDYKPSLRPGYYDWRVHLSVDDKVANQIDAVTYTLHRTFKNPETTIRNDPHGLYALERSGWGEFEIKADVKLRKGNVITKYYWLNLGSRGFAYGK